MNTKDAAIAIEKNVPMPGGRGAASRFPFVDMQIGDSFMVPCADDSKVRALAQTIRTTGSQLKPKKFTVRQVEGGVRTWRTA